MKKIFFAIAAFGLLLFSSCSSSAQLKFAVAEFSTACPTEIVDGLTCTDVFTENQSVVFFLSVDEIAADMNVEDLNNPLINVAMKAVTKEEMFEEPDENTADFLRLCKESNYDIVFRYEGSVSGQTADVVLSADEL